MADEKQDYPADHDIWVNADYSKVVEAGSPEAAFILTTAGHAVEHDSALRLGLLKPTKEEKVELKKAADTGGTSTASK